MQKLNKDQIENVIGGIGCVCVGKNIEVLYFENESECQNVCCNQYNNTIYQTFAESDPGNVNLEHCPRRKTNIRSEFNMLATVTS